MSATGPEQRANVDAERLIFEKEKWRTDHELEERKLSLETRKMWISAASIVVPALILAATLYANARSQERASRDALDLKVADTVLGSKGISEATGRAEALSHLFPDKLPAEYSRRLEELAARPRQPDKARLLELLARAPAQDRAEVLSLWLLLYPGDREKLAPELLTHFSPAATERTE